ncbi:MAG: hypothetical protein H7641_13350 [Candidatus Heimdallarchaeota archaeon]|nr:hypothetical protein [Candidatus Heimdallarchaeota archaeon]MCK4878546.1 hypothetical protein [Candidatus Heimdallarchaeota archaeon]
MATESVAVKTEEKLGTYISPHDLSRILSPGLRKASIVRSYFVDAEEERFNKIMNFATKVANCFLEFYPDKIVSGVLIQFQRFLPDLLDDYDKRYFTKNHIAIHYLALLDYRLSLVGSKLSPKHIDYVRELLDIRKTKIFSFFSVKKTQSDLIAAGYIQRKHRHIYSPLLKDRVSQFINDLTLLFPEFEEDLDRLQDKAFFLIDERIVPRIDVELAALVIVSSLLPFFIIDRSVTNTIWLVVKDEFNVELDFLKRKVYRYRGLIRKKDVAGLLGLGKMEESANNADTSDINKYV